MFQLLRSLTNFFDSFTFVSHLIFLILRHLYLHSTLLYTYRQQFQSFSTTGLYCSSFSNIFKFIYLSNSFSYYPSALVFGSKDINIITESFARSCSNHHPSALLAINSGSPFKNIKIISIHITGKYHFLTAFHRLLIRY
ncbi:uncharacterized protein LOC114743976 [Neltuma alba]|uniref:uncharacterized protein LOC114743976 n=1 Tax=Neltuma alba TaxID=207710 RepID=UPI0010A39A59|nr:uncharacterized protein LOC114743976 [Prosopis alba]